MTEIEAIVEAIQYDRFNPNISAEEIAAKVAEALKSEAAQMVREGRAITVIIPAGYETVWDFLNDCGLEAVGPGVAPSPQVNADV